MLKTFKNINKLFNKFGIKELILRIIITLLSPIVSVRYVYKIDVIDNNLNINNTDTNFFLTESNIKDLDHLFENNPGEISKKRYFFLKEIIDAPGSHLYIVENKNSEKLGYGCLTFGIEAHSKILKRINGLNLDKNGYLFRDYTFTRSRDLGVHKFLIYERLNLLKKNKFKTATSRIAYSNTASKISYEKAGFKKQLLELDFHFFHILKRSRYLLFNIGKEK